MESKLIIDDKQVFIGENSRLTLEMNIEDQLPKGTLADKFKDKSIYLLFKNLDKDDVGMIEYVCTITGNKLKLKQAYSTSFKNLFRRIGLLVDSFDIPAGQTDISIPWQIDVWDTVGTYTIDSAIGPKGQQTLNLATDPANFTRIGPILLRVVEESNEIVNVALQETNREATPDQLLWILIRSRTLDFNRYREFMDLVLCSDNKGADLQTYRDYADKRYLPFSRAASYSMLKFATEYYLMQECGLVPPKGSDLSLPISRDVTGDTQRTRRSNISSINILQMREEYLSELGSEGGHTLPYFKVIRDKLSELPLKKDVELPYDACYGILQSRLTSPPLLELIWSYWHEEGGLVQTLNALSLRFQNVRRGVDRDPLANLAIDPLRPLSNLLWGYIEDERNRLTINRRNLEYQYEYGISLIGKAVQNIPVAEHRTNFLRGFHELLRAAVEFYQQANFTTVIPDGFPILNHLREVHLMLAEGAHNQYGDLPWTARVEMLTQQWLLARSEVREFLGGRIMVPYSEPWMDRVDNMKQLQGWNPTNITHFRDLGVFGEQLLLSIRYGSWNDPTLGGQNAANWAHYWRAEIQRYIHAYKAVTGVDLASDIVDTRVSLPANEDRYQQPAQLIERQVAMRQNGQMRPRQVSGSTLNAQLPPNSQLIRKEYNG